MKDTKVTPEMDFCIDEDAIKKYNEHLKKPIQTNPMIWVQHNGVWKGTNMQPADPKKLERKKKKQKRKRKVNNR